MENGSGIHLVYKEIGETPNEAILRFRYENPEFEGERITYAGRLDPMAEGFLLLLSGEEVNQKEKYLNFRKKYEFEVLWGVETDTLDILGIVGNKSEIVPSQDEVIKILDNKKRKFIQKYPIFSSKTVNGKQLWQWAREGKENEIKIPEHQVEIFEIKYIDRNKIKSNDFLEKITEKIKKVKGDFRQIEVLKEWDYLKNENREYILDKILIEVSSGFYIRQFIKDLSEELKSCALAYSIKRTKIGDLS